MDVLAYCRAMGAFCRQRAVFEGENDAFWRDEAAEWDKLISEYAISRPQIRTRTSGPEQGRVARDRCQVLSAARAFQADQARWRISP
jgi:hypothetical protein